MKVTSIPEFVRRSKVWRTIKPESGYRLTGKERGTNKKAIAWLAEHGLVSPNPFGHPIIYKNWS